MDFFASMPAISHPAAVAQDVGLGYLTLGQPSADAVGRRGDIKPAPPRGRASWRGGDRGTTSETSSPKAGWIVDLRPRAARSGSSVVATCPPGRPASWPGSHTGAALCSRVAQARRLTQPQTRCAGGPEGAQRRPDPPCGAEAGSGGEREQPAQAARRTAVSDEPPSDHAVQQQHTIESPGGWLIRNARSTSATPPPVGT